MHANPFVDKQSTIDRAATPLRYSRLQWSLASEERLKIRLRLPISLYSPTTDRARSGSTGSQCQKPHRRSMSPRHRIPCVSLLWSRMMESWPRRGPRNRRAPPQSDWIGKGPPRQRVHFSGGPFGWAGTTVILAKEAFDAWAAARDSGVNVLQISNSEAAQLTLPPGHPQLRTLYAAHPTLPSTYYTAASFHRMVFEHKFAEAVEILMSLGASHIDVEHVHGWSREFSATMNASIPSVSVDASGASNSARSHSLLFKADFENVMEPSLPKDLVWYPHEATWRNMADGRLTYGMKEFSLVVNYQDDFGVNAGLKVKAEKAGLEMGGSFENHMVTSWKISGKFHERRA